MRRLTIVPEPLRDRTAGSGPTSRVEADSSPPVPLLRLVLDLEAITPIVGGGPETREPDPVDPVRIPSIRGALRDWWRVVGDETDPEALFQSEALLWGGVGLKKADPERAAGSREQDARKHDARTSRARLWIDQVVDPGKDLPAGYHRRRGTRLQTLPDWRLGSRDDVGYGLFPLQRDQEERNKARTAAGDLPTPRVREGLRFRLRLDVVALGEDLGPRKNANLEDEVDRPDFLSWWRDRGLRRLMATLWAWIHFGGLGARTTRGFGQLRLHTIQEVDGSAAGEAPTGETSREVLEVLEHTRSVLQEWIGTPGGGKARGIFHTVPMATPRAVADYLERFYAAAGIATTGTASSREWPSLQGATVMVGEAREDPLRALQKPLGALKTFRQGPGVGRAPGSYGRPGRSYWPEADAMKLVWEEGNEEDWNQELLHSSRHAGHPIRPDADKKTPRAAFGMPLLVKFHYQHRFDQKANGQILPLAPKQDSGQTQQHHTLERFRSPVRFGVLACANRKYLPLVLVLNVEIPEVDIELDKKAKRDEKAANASEAVSWKAEHGEGAQPPIRGRLATVRGDTLEAWCRWLKDQEGFQYVIRGGKGGTR